MSNSNNLCLNVTFIPRSLKSKCQPVLMDGTLNTMETVMVNLFQLLLLTAYKFISCEQKLPPKQRVANNLP